MMIKRLFSTRTIGKFPITITDNAWNKMNKIVKIVMSTLVGAGCFSAGLYYATLEFDKTLDNVMGEYEVISEKVNTFTDLTNPKTVQAYTKELRRILDDIKFLHTLIEGGQMADAKLDDYLEEQQGNVDEFKETCNVYVNKIYEQCEIANDLSKGKVIIEPFLHINGRIVRIILDVMLTGLEMEIYSGDNSTAKIPSSVIRL